MAIQVLTNCSFIVNSVDLSDHVKQLAVAYSAKAVDATKMGDDTTNFLAGLKDWTFEVTMHKDEASAKVDQTLFPLVGPGVAAFTVEVRPVNAIRSATNPGYNATAMLESYPPLGVTVGGIGECKAVFRPSGASPTLLRSTS